MRKIISILIIYTLIILLYAHTTENFIYNREAVVTDIDNIADIVTAEDLSGNIWAFYGAENLKPGDVITLVMDNNKTGKIEDDIITDYMKY